MASSQIAKPCIKRSGASPQPITNRKASKSFTIAIQNKQELNSSHVANQAKSKSITTGFPTGGLEFILGGLCETLTVILNADDK